MAWWYRDEDGRCPRPLTEWHGITFWHKPATNDQPPKGESWQRLFSRAAFLQTLQFCPILPHSCTGPNNHKSLKEETPIFAQVCQGTIFLVKTIRFQPNRIDSLLLWIRQSFLTFFHNFAKQLLASSVPSRCQAWWWKIFECIWEIIKLGQISNAVSLWFWRFERTVPFFYILTVFAVVILMDVFWAKHLLTYFHKRGLKKSKQWEDGKEAFSREDMRKIFHNNLPCSVAIRVTRF